MVIGVEPDLSCQDVIGRVRNEHRVVARVHRAVLLDEIEQVRHLFQIGWNVWIIASEVNVIELHVDDVLELSRRRIQLALCVSRRHHAESQ